MDDSGHPHGQFYYLSQERKLANIQRQEEHVERLLLAQSKQLQHFHDYLEKEQRQTKDRVLDGLHNERKLLLNEEANRLYGREHRVMVVPGMLETVLSERRKEFMKNQEGIMLQMRNLNEERLRLHQARERIRENQGVCSGYSPLPSPVYSLTGTDHGFRDDETLFLHETERDIRNEEAWKGSSPHEMETFITEVKRKLPLETQAYFSRRSIFNKEYDQKLKPYTGELGWESYAPWQMEDYTMVRKLLDEFVDGFLDKYLPPDYHLLETEVAQARLAADVGEKHLMRQATAEGRAISLIAEEIVLEVTGSMAQSVVTDVRHLTGVLRNLTDQTIMTLAEHVVTGNERGHAPGDPEYKHVTKTFFVHQRERNLSRVNLWTHTQSLSVNVTDVQDKLLEDEDAYANDGTPLIDFDSAAVVDVGLPLVARRKDGIRGEQLAQNHYITKELKYWRETEPFLFSITLARKCRGVTAVQPSADHRYLALGTGHGDLLVYGLWTSPWLIVRVAINQGKADDPVVNIHWSLDHSRLVSVNKMGGVQLWSMKPWGAVVDRATLKGLGLTLTNNSYLPFQLLPLLCLHTEDGDFRFHAGPLAERQAIPDDYFPTQATFFPDMTLLGVQLSVCVALSSGDILKLNTESAAAAAANQHSVQGNGLGEGATGQSSSKLSQPSTRFLHQPLSSNTPNLVGGGMLAELLRKHTSPLMLIGYLQNCEQMVSVDEQGYISLWNYSREDTKGSDWMEPAHRYRINPYKTMYSPGKDSLRNVIFSEKELKSKDMSTEHIDAKRKKADAGIKSRDVGRPWHVREIPAQRLTACTYLPNYLIPSSGAVFHTVMRHQPGGLLSAYFTRHYKPVKVKSSRMLGCCLNPSTTQLIMLLLYPEVTPKGHHISAVVIDLLTMTVKDLRVDIPVSEDQYLDAIETSNVSFGVSRVIGPPGTDYLFLSVGGEISGVSLLTGQVILQLEDPSANNPDFGGCSVDAIAWSNPPNTKISVVSCAGNLYVVNYAQKSNTVNVLMLQARASRKGRRKMAVAFKRWGKQPLCPPSERVDGGQFYIAGEVHPEVFAYSLCLDLIDRVVARKGEQPVKTNNIDMAYLAIQEKRKNTHKKNGGSK